VRLSKEGFEAIRKLLLAELETETSGFFLRAFASMVEGEGLPPERPDDLASGIGYFFRPSVAASLLLLREAMGRTNLCRHDTIELKLSNPGGHDYLRVERRDDSICSEFDGPSLVLTAEGDINDAIRRFFAEEYRR
jgi:hypothetical protein